MKTIFTMCTSWQQFEDNAGQQPLLPQLVLPLPCLSTKYDQDCLVVTASLTQQERIEQCKIHNRCKIRPSPSCEFAGWGAAVLEESLYLTAWLQELLHCSGLSQGTSAEFCSCRWSNAIWPRGKTAFILFYFYWECWDISRKAKKAPTNLHPKRCFSKLYLIIVGQEQLSL